jgi:hypothetical protein
LSESILATIAFLKSVILFLQLSPEPNTPNKQYVVNFLQSNLKFWQIAITLLHIPTYSNYAIKRIWRLTFSSQNRTITLLRKSPAIAMQIVGKIQPLKLESSDCRAHMSFALNNAMCDRCSRAGQIEAVTTGSEWREPLLYAW